MNKPKHTHSIGHTLIIIGSICALITLVISSPFNLITSHAIGTKDIIDLVNKERALQDKKALNINEDLMNAAQKRAEDMVKQHYFSHYGPDGSSPWEYFKNVNYVYQAAGENLAITNSTNKAIIDNWMQSPTHKENLIGSKFNDIGVGVANFGTYENNKDTTIVVALFGSQTNTGVSNGSETTFPAGPISIISNPNDFTAKLSLSICFALILSGLLLEYRQIQRHKHLQNQN